MKTYTLEQLRADLKARVDAVGGCTAFARQVGLSHSAWSNIIYDPRRRPGPEMLARLGYAEVEIEPRYRRLKE